MSKPTDERFTPKKYIDSIRKVLGKIDLDPASSNLANTRIKAENIFTLENSGLENGWFGNIFCNPPYSRGNLSLWCNKIKSEFMQENFQNGIYLIPSDTSTNWFRIINNFPFCATDHRITFLTYNEYRKQFIFEKNPENGSCFFLFSHDNSIREQFRKEFSKYGPIFMRIN